MTSYQSLRWPTTVRIDPALTTAAGERKSCVQIVDWSTRTTTIVWALALAAYAARKHEIAATRISGRCLALIASSLGEPRATQRDPRLNEPITVCFISGRRHRVGHAKKTRGLFDEDFHRPRTGDSLADDQRRNP